MKVINEYVIPPNITIFPFTKVKQIKKSTKKKYPQSNQKKKKKSTKKQTKQNKFLTKTKNSYPKIQQMTIRKKKLISDLDLWETCK